MTEPSSLLVARVRRVVADYVGHWNFEAETRLHEALGLDCVHLVELTGAIEDALLAPIPECELIDHLVTVDDLYTLAATAVEAAQGARRVA